MISYIYARIFPSLKRDIARKILILLAVRATFESLAAVWFNHPLSLSASLSAIPSSLLLSTLSARLTRSFLLFLSLFLLLVPLYAMLHRGRSSGSRPRHSFPPSLSLTLFFCLYSPSPLVSLFILPPLVLSRLWLPSRFNLSLFLEWHTTAIQRRIVQRVLGKCSAQMWWANQSERYEGDPGEKEFYLFWVARDRCTWRVSCIACCKVEL